MASSVSGRSAAKSKAAKAPQKALSLKEKYDVIETSKKNPGMAVRALAAKFGCGRSQINSVLKNKESIIELYESNMSSTSVLSRKRCRESDFSEVNEVLYSLYLLATSRNIYPGGPSSVKKQSKLLFNWVFLISKPQTVGWQDGRPVIMSNNLEYVASLGK